MLYTLRVAKYQVFAVPADNPTRHYLADVANPFKLRCLLEDTRGVLNEALWHHISVND